MSCWIEVQIKPQSCQTLPSGHCDHIGEVGIARTQTEQQTFFKRMQRLKKIVLGENQMHNTLLLIPPNVDWMVVGMEEEKQEMGAFFGG